MTDRYIITYISVLVNTQTITFYILLTKNMVYFVSESCFPKLCVESVSLKKIVMRALLDYVSVLHNEDEIGLLDGGKSVCHYKRGPSDSKLVKCFSYLAFGEHVY